jgi:hypothetical protein
MSLLRVLASSALKLGVYVKRWTCFSRAKVRTMHISTLAPNEVFVFGSNASGFHGAGAAATAVEKFGAVWGEGHGLHGQSYAIDTMSGFETIEAEASTFLAFATEHPELTFLVTPIGCGIAGYTPDQIGPLFRDASANVVLPELFLPFTTP